MPETLIFTTSRPGALGGDEVVISRAAGEGTVAFIQIITQTGSAEAYLTSEEAAAMAGQLLALVVDAAS